MVLPVIRAPFDDAAVLAKLRPAFAAERSLLLPGACDSRLLRAPPMKRFFLAHRGRYEVAELPPREDLRSFAEALTRRRLTPSWLRLFRFRRGGYALILDDALSRIEAGVELTLDLSREIAGAPVVYQRGPYFLVVPQLPGLVAVVERTPAVFRYDRYLPASVGRATVLRLRAAFRYAD